MKAETNNIESTSVLPLDRSSAGQRLRILSLPESAVRAQLIRLGLCEGVHIICFQRLPGGTVVVQKNRQQIAIGHTVAQQIFVALVNLEVEHA